MEYYRYQIEVAKEQTVLFRKLNGLVDVVIKKIGE
jgi:hypothetical protein